MASNHTWGILMEASPGSAGGFIRENAAGNFTGIVQRVPVKIVLDHESTRGYEERLVPDLSVETDVSLSVSMSYQLSNPAAR